MSEAATTPPETTRELTTALTRENLDTVNLERALIDFDIANARVIELTARLTQLSIDLQRARADLGLAELAGGELSARNEALERELADLKASIAYRSARFLGDFRAKARRR